MIVKVINNKNDEYFIEIVNMSLFEKYLKDIANYNGFSIDIIKSANKLNMLSVSKEQLSNMQRFERKYKIFNLI